MAMEKVTWGLTYFDQFTYYSKKVRIFFRFFFKFHDFSMHGTFLFYFPGFPALVKIISSAVLSASPFEMSLYRDISNGLADNTADDIYSQSAAEAF